jgi:ribosomal protein S12 methylthiotransferase
MPTTAAPKGTYAFVSLGCPKNTVDSERMLGKLAQDGYALSQRRRGRCRRRQHLRVH